MPAFEWVHVQLHQQKGMISLSPPTICNSAHRADSLTVNHSRKVVPVWVSRVETILRQCAQQTTWPSQVVGSGVADELDKLV
ncbi:hypothetical protein QS369_25410 [Escherichia coli]|nr:hypothetical protein [Escherichia coli]